MFKVLYSRPSWHLSVKNSRASFMRPDMGSSFLGTHQPRQVFHADWNAASVPGMWLANRRFETFSRRWPSCYRRLRPTVSNRLTGLNCSELVDKPCCRNSLENWESEQGAASSTEGWPNTERPRLIRLDPWSVSTGPSSSSWMEGTFKSPDP